MTLYIKPISALLTHDTEIFSNMDPYVILKINDEKRRSRTHKEGGKKPKWDEVLTFKINNPKTMQLVVMDEDTVTDDVVGSASVDLKKYLNSPGEHKQYISLVYKNRNAGKIYLSIRYEPSGVPNSNNQGMGMGMGMGMNQANSGWGSQPQQPYNPYQQQNYNQSTPANMYQQNYGQGNYSGWGPNPGNNSGWGPNPSNNSGWGPNPTNNSGWGPNPNPTNNSGWGANQATSNFDNVLAQNLMGNMQQQNQPPPQDNVLNLLGNVLQNNVNQPPPQQQNPYGSTDNDGWGPNNNGWGSNNGNSGW